MPLRLRLGIWGDRCGGKPTGAGLTRTTRQANHAPSPSKWGMRVGAACTQTGVLAKGGAKGFAGEIEELGREKGLAGACPPPQGGGPPRGGDRHASPLTGDPRGA